VIDLRSRPRDRTGSASREPETDFAQKFPQVGLIRLSRKEPSSGKQGNHALDALIREKGTRSGRLYVLIDDGDGTAEEAAHRLKAAGIRRVVILAGGEEALRTEGRSELKVQKSR
jgi:3-mercaptopyruvate sulfurtransferase SseA